MAGAAMLPHAAVRSAGAVRDLSDSGLIVRLTRGRGWIAVLSALLGGIVALNVVSLSLTAGSGRLSLQIDELQAQNSSLRAQIEERLSADRVEAEAARLGLAVPDPKQITYLSASDRDAARLAHLLGTDTFLMAPSQPSSYPSNPPPTAPPSGGGVTQTTGSSGSTGGGATQTTPAPTGGGSAGGAPNAAPAGGGGSPSPAPTTGGVGL
jgi:hypothetical protein